MKCVSKLIILAALGASASAYELRGASITLKGASSARAKKGTHTVMIHKGSGGGDGPGGDHGGGGGGHDDHHDDKPDDHHDDNGPGDDKVCEVDRYYIFGFWL